MAISRPSTVRQVTQEPKYLITLPIAGCPFLPSYNCLLGN